MSIVLSTPSADTLAAVVDALRVWQHDGASVQLHPGDVGWLWRFGATATAAALRTWSRDGRLVAVGMADGEGLVRLAIAPEAEQDAELAQRMAADLDPGHGVLPAGPAAVEARWDGALPDLLLRAGWERDEPWTPLSRDLTEPIEPPSIRVEAIGPDSGHVHVADRVAVQRAAFANSTFTEERWHAMAAGSPYAEARCLVGYDAHDTAVAAATVWLAGPGRPGLMEPVGVHRDHQGRGYGRAITLAAAIALRELGSSSATVCTPAANVAAVATYRSAGMRQLPDVRDLRRG